MFRMTRRKTVAALAALPVIVLTAKGQANDRRAAEAVLASEDTPKESCARSGRAETLPCTATTIEC